MTRSSTTCLFRIFLPSCKWPLSDLDAKSDVHPMLISKWKKRSSYELCQVFSDGASTKQVAEQQTLIDSLFRKIGKLQVKLEVLQRRCVFSVPQASSLVETDHLQLSLGRQRALLSISPAGPYYKARAD